MMWHVEVAGVALVGGDTSMRPGKRAALAGAWAGALLAEEVRGALLMEERREGAVVGEWTVVAAAELCRRLTSAAEQGWVIKLVWLE